MRGFFTEFKQTLRRLRGQIFGWGIGLALYGLLMGSLFDAVKSMPGLTELVEQYPPEVLAFFGNGLDILNTAQGYFTTYYSSYIPIILGIFAVSAAAALLAGDEERGTLDLVLAYPIGRGTLYWGRALGYGAALALTMLIAYLGWLISLPFSGLEISAWQLLAPFVPIFALMTLFGGLSLLLSLILPSARLASTTAGGLLVANFLLQGLANMNEPLQSIMRLTPFHFYQMGEAMDGLNWGWTLGLLAVGALFAAAGALLFQRRDIRVGGERG